MSWLRVRFYTSSDDPRPVKFPPPGPYWVSGYSGDDQTVLIAFLKTEDQLLEFWPEAELDDWTEEKEIKFTERFPKPSWYQEQA